MKIIDSQVHVWGPNTPERPWVPNIAPQMPEPLTAERLLAAMDEAGVDRAVLVPPVLEGDRNDLALAAAAAHPDRFAVMGRILLDKPEAPEKLNQMMAQKGMLGIRLSFLRENAREMLHGGKTDWFWPEAERRGIPLMVFAPGLAPAVGEIARVRPKLKILFDHMAFSQGMPTEEMTRTVEQLLDLAPLPNVSVKVSALPCYSAERYPFRDMHEPIRRIVEKFGAKRCFWGTDYSRLPPNCSYRHAITMFTEEMKFLSSDDLEWIMGRALAETINWPIGG